MDYELLNKLRATAVDLNEKKVYTENINYLSGFSGQKLLSCIQHYTEQMCNADSVYLEIGVFQGLTLISNARKNPGIACFGIDNFSLFNEGAENLNIVQARIKEQGISNANIINLDYEDALNKLSDWLNGRKIGVFFIDGPHDYRSQLVPLLLVKPYLAQNCVIIIDDANYPHVRQASADFLRSHAEFAMLFEAYTPTHLANMNDQHKNSAKCGWWNGVNVIIRDQEHLVPRTFPREENKHLYFASHEIFRHEFAELAYPAISTFQKIIDAPKIEADEIMSKLKMDFSEHRRQNPTRFKHQNTYSSDLPTFIIHV